MKYAGDIVIGLLLLTVLVLMLAGCSGVSTQAVAYMPAPDSCVKVSAYEWNNAATSFICFGPDGKVIGMVAGTAQSPLDLVSGYANAALIGAMIPLGASLLAPATTVTTGK